MSDKNKIRRFVESRIITWIGIVFMGVLLSSGKMAHLIGNYFPVITQLEITSIKSVTSHDMSVSLVSGISQKLRNCDERSMEWFTTKGRNEGAVLSMFLDMPKSRNTGEIVFNGLIVGLPPEDIVYARAEMTHDCLNGSVRVVSNFFEGSLAK